MREKCSYGKHICNEIERYAVWLWLAEILRVNCELIAMQWRGRIRVFAVAAAATAATAASVWYAIYLQLLSA